MKGTCYTGDGEIPRILVTYKGSGLAGNGVQDDYLTLDMALDGKEESLASATVNFPVLEGKKTLFIHCLDGEDKEAGEYLMEVIENFARSRNYRDIYINTGRQKKRFLKKHGFEPIPKQQMARKHLEQEVEETREKNERGEA